MSVARQATTEIAGRGRAELALLALIVLCAMVTPTACGGTSGSTSGTPSHTSHSYPLQAVADSGVRGRADVSGGQGSFTITLHLKDLEPNSTDAAAILSGTCAQPRGTVYEISDVLANAHGVGVSLTTIQHTFRAPASGWQVTVDQGSNPSAPIACGELGSAATPTAS